MQPMNNNNCNSDLWIRLYLIFLSIRCHCIVLLRQCPLHQQPRAVTVHLQVRYGLRRFNLVQHVFVGGRLRPQEMSRPPPTHVMQVNASSADHRVTLLGFSHAMDESTPDVIRSFSSCLCSVAEISCRPRTARSQLISSKHDRDASFTPAKEECCGDCTMIFGTWNKRREFVGELGSIHRSLNCTVPRRESISLWDFRWFHKSFINLR